MALCVHLGSAVSLSRIPPSTSGVQMKGVGWTARFTAGLRMTTVGRGAGRCQHGW